MLQFTNIVQSVQQNTIKYDTFQYYIRVLLLSFSKSEFTLKFVMHIWIFPNSNLDLVTSYPEWAFFLISTEQMGHKPFLLRHRSVVSRSTLWNVYCMLHLN
jgi:hypothetical protein